MTLKQLLEERTRIIAAMRQITDNPAHAGDLSEDQETRFDNMKSDLAKVEKKIEQQQVLDDAERRAIGRPIAGRADHRWNHLLQDFSLCRALMAADPTVDAGLEREVSQEMQKRTGRQARGMMIPHELFIRPAAEYRDGQIVGDATKGGYLVPDQYRPDLMIDLLRASSVLGQLGVTVLNGLVGQTVIPRITGTGNVTWVGENEEADVSEMAFGNITLTPRTVSGQMAYSRQMLLNSNPSIEALLRRDIAQNVATAIDTSALNGQQGKELRGLLTFTDLPKISLGNNGGMPVPDELIDLTGMLDVANSLSGNLKWLTNPKVTKTIAKLKNPTTSEYLFLNSLPNSLLGYPLARSTTVPSTLTKGTGTNLSPIIFGDWSTMILGYWSGLDILSNPYSRAAKGQVLIHAFQDVDMNVRHIESFAAHVDITAS